ncbi:HlyD family type I secretion periplasmic adaptor subunit [Sphingomonas sp. 1P08PE]|uniref:HlyD family type I secretion periplasmic adaptor subunit n=1 Tax=Sphingomonas sp. 1P08PE TaxID=554122 RepID=UPI00399FDF6C
MAATHIENLADRIRPRVASSVLLWGILAFLVIAVAWAALAEIDRTVRAQGRVIPGAELQIVSNLEGGIVDRILVRTGQTVRAGTPLIRLDRTASGSEYGSSRAAFDALDARVARLDAEVVGRDPVYGPPADAAAAGQIATERALHASRMADLASTLAAAQSRIVQAERAIGEAEASAAARRAASEAARRELAMIRPLVERGIEPRLTLIQTENAAAVADSEATAAGAAIARARSAAVEARANYAQARQNWRSRAADELATARGEYAQRRTAMPALADKVTRTVVRAPLAGRVNRVMVTTVGGTVAPGAPLVEIVPSEDGLLIDARVNPRDIAAIRMGQPSKVELTAYDPAVYGSLPGRVVSISPDSVLDQRTNEAYYLVRVRTSRESLNGRGGSALPIGPGMVATVSLLGDKRSVLSYILAPFTRLRDQALRD